MTETNIQVQLVTEQPINVSVGGGANISIALDGQIGPKGDPLSIPPDGYAKVLNIYVNPQNHKLYYEYDDGG